MIIIIFFIITIMIMIIIIFFFIITIMIMIIIIIFYYYYYDYDYHYNFLLLLLWLWLSLYFIIITIMIMIIMMMTIVFTLHSDVKPCESTSRSRAVGPMSKWLDAVFHPHGGLDEDTSTWTGKGEKASSSSILAEPSGLCCNNRVII